jgi:hypothetical protein
MDMHKILKQELFKDILASLIILIIIALSFNARNYSADNNVSLLGESYELNEESNFDISTATAKSQLCFGKSSVGSLTISGEISKEGEYDNYKTFGTTSELSLSYQYDGSFSDSDKEDWNITLSDSKSINGIDISKKIGTGAIIVQSSTDGNNWETVYTSTNILKKKKQNSSDFYTISENSIRTGTYFKVILGYKMQKRTGTEKSVLFINKEVYEYKDFVEMYNFYVCYEDNPVTINDVITGEIISSGSTATNGFSINKNDTNCNVDIIKGGVTTKNVADLTTFSDAGEYTITISTKLNTEYKYEITIVDGIKMTQAEPIVYESDKKEIYSENTTPLGGNTSFGVESLTKLKIGQEANSQIKTSQIRDFSSYGITGKSVSLFLNISDCDAIKNNEWEIYSDTWGKKEKEKVADVWAGCVQTGALLIQKSSDGESWENVEEGAYANGLYTDDFYNYYGNKGDVLIYTPNGDDVLNGIYLKVYYAYEVYQSSTKTHNRYLEVYKLYLCSNELNAVTFHNLSLDGNSTESIGEDDSELVEIYKTAETLVSGSGTVSGFSIDTSLNPTVKYTVYKDGKEVAIPSNHQFTTSGKYEINLISAVGDERNVIIYVDTQTGDEAFEKYFGKNFILGKRIYSESEYPVFEGGQTRYYIEKEDSSYLPISGTIKNITTGTEKEISSSKNNIAGGLYEAGIYEATFTTCQYYQGNKLAGDYRNFKFKFEIIEEGTAPGPVVNKKSLEEYSKSSISDSYPMYYGLTYQSASKGYITLAFATKEDAVDYAYNYEKGMVEEQPDGTYRYTGSFHAVQKDQYISAWDLTDAMNYFAEQAVEIGYFDMSDEFTYLSLSDDVIDNTENLRTLELDRSVTIIADGEEDKLRGAGNILTISRKPYSNLIQGSSGNVDSGYRDFEFVKDENGYDSYTVLITDAKGNEYPIEYNVGVGKQLSEYGCESGIVTITEKTVYGDETSYEAVYIAENDNTAEIEITYYEDGIEKKAKMNMQYHPDLSVSAFKISDIIDSLDEYTLVTVSDLSDKTYLVSDQTLTDVWVTPDVYHISVINRLGYSYKFNITINNSEYAAISFDGVGTDNIQDIITSYGMKNVKLPVPERVGYEFVGYKDENGNIYTNNIAQIDFKGSKLLESVWKAKEYQLTLEYPNGDEYQSLIVEFGQKYDLPTPEMEKGEEFVGWMQDGNILDNNYCVVNSEGDIVLVASIISSDEASTDIDEIDGNTNNVIIGGIIALFVLIIIAIILYKKKVSKKVSNNKV